MRRSWHQVVAFLLAMQFATLASGQASSNIASPCAAAVADPCLRYCFPHVLQYQLHGLDEAYGHWTSPASAAELGERCVCSTAETYYLEFVNACRPLQPGAVRVFESGDKGIDTCYRIPAIVKTVHNTLLAFAEVRHNGCGDSRKVEIAMSRSVDSGQTWSDVQFIAGDKEHPVGNPMPIATTEGRVVLPYVKDKVGSFHSNGNGVVFSDDDGITWSKEEDITSQLGPAKTAHPGPNAGLELMLPSGVRRLLVAAHLEHYLGVLIYYSDDQGQTWTTVPEEQTPFFNLTEPGVADLGNGELLIQMRHREEPNKGKAISRSVDYGMTWSDVHYDSDLLGPICQGSITSFGGSVYFANTASPTERVDLTIRRSNDGGRTWPKSMVIQQQPSFGYSSMVQGHVPPHRSHGGILYESITQGAIDFMRFPLSLDPSPAPLVV